MSFAWPHLLLLLVLPVLLLVWELRRRQQRRVTFHPKILQAEAGQNQLRLQGPGAAASARARIWLCLGLALAVVALARPQWGRLEEPVFDQSREILIAVDLSRSMLAQDVKPSRLDRAKLLINSLLEKLAGERVGLAVFSGTAFLQSPLSADYEILREFLPALGPDYLPEGGTNYRALLETSLQAFGAGTAADRFLVVLSDGGATDDDWQSLVPELKKKNIRAICLGIGTGGGAMIPDGSGAFMKDDRGAVVLSKLESSTLQKLARETDGVYRDASSWVDLASVLQKTVEAGRKGKFVDKKTVRLVERYQWALAPALLCLLLSFWLEFPVRPRPRALKLTPSGPTTVAAVLVALFLSLAGTHPLRASVTAIPTPAPPASADTASEKPGLSPLGKIVSRLSAQPTQSGRDWAELARQTVTWGQKLKTDHQPVPEGPVNDALAAVAAGEKLDAKTADWDQLRQQLKALLEKPGQPPPQKKPQDQSKDQKDRQQQSDKDQSKQDKSSPSQEKKDQPHQDKQNQKGGSPDQPQSGKNADQQKSQDKPGRPDKPQPDSGRQKSAFGDMKQKSAPPPPSQGEMQKVGGAPQDKTPPPDQLDPALAMPLQKLQQIRADDSPAQLFQLMEGKPQPSPSKNGKNW